MEFVADVFAMFVMADVIAIVFYIGWCYCQLCYGWCYCHYVLLLADVIANFLCGI